MLYDYFKQLFAQVTNPAIDSIREEVIMSLECYIGPEQNLLETTEEHCPSAAGAASDSVQRATGRAQAHRSSRLEDRRRSTSPGREAKGKAGMADGARSHLRRSRSRPSTTAIRWWSCPIAQIGADRVPVSSLLATGAVHHHLVRQTKRTRIGIVVETGEAREVHHHCLLVGYGADAINPYLAFEALWQARRDGSDRPSAKATGEGEHPPSTDDEHTIRTADPPIARRVAKGMLKVMAKMGISTLQSYKGAQIFEAVGLTTK